MQGNNFISLVTGLGAGLLFINGQTPGALTQQEIILDVFLISLVLVCIIFNKNLSALAERNLPFIKPVLDSVEACCEDVNNRKNDCENEQADNGPVEEVEGVQECNCENKNDIEDCA